MAKNLFLIRHAAAEHTQYHDDFNRPLSAAGFLEVSKMSERLYNHDTLPQLLISSPALRALTTAKIFAENLNIPLDKIQPENMIYEASRTTLLNIINHLDNRYKNIALFGHNPGISDIHNYLCSEFTVALPTCAIVQLEFQTDDWQEIGLDSGYVAWKALP